MKTLEEEWRFILKEAVEKEETAGISLLFLKEGKEVCFIGEGYADREKKIKVDRGTIFRLYSMTKPVTAAAAMILAEDGELELDAPVGEYLPSFRNSGVWCGNITEPAARPILISDLLTMTSGLSYGDDDTVTELATRKLLAEAEASLELENPMTTLEFAERAGEIPLLFHPGTSWKYGISADILGAVIEKASGRTFGEFLEERLFAPLGMKDTGFFVPQEKRSRLAKAYDRTEDKILFPYEGSFLGIRNHMDRPAAYESGGAGLVSTAEDYAKFARMLLDRGSLGETRILKPESVEQMGKVGLTPQHRAAFEKWFGQRGYDYGWLMRVLREPSMAVTPGLKGEYCWDGWLGCCFLNYPREKMTLLIMQQQKNGGDAVSRIKEALVRHQNGAAGTGKVWNHYQGK